MLSVALATRLHPARVLTPVPSGKSRLHHRNACGASLHVGEAGLEPAHPLLIRQVPSPVWPLSRSAGGDRTRVIRIMSPALEPLSYRAVPGWDWLARRGLNPLPLAYQTSALTR